MQRYDFFLKNASKNQTIFLMIVKFKEKFSLVVFSEIKEYLKHLFWWNYEEFKNFCPKVQELF